jgi:hypothetical protein
MDGANTGGDASRLDFRVWYQWVPESRASSAVCSVFPPQSIISPPSRRFIVF